MERIKRFSVKEYHRLAEIGVLTPEDNVELINGWIVQAMPANPPHKKCLRRLNRLLPSLIPGVWVLDSQAPVTIGDSEPEPDFAVTVGPEDRYDDRHAGPGEIVFVIEVSDTTLATDRGEKMVLYARAKVPVYWIINLIDRRVEVYTNPRGGRNPTYRTRTDYAPGAAVPVVVGGRTVGTVPVNEVLP
jgi:Uma2 family endonuclease